MREGIGQYKGKRKDTHKWVEGNYLRLHNPDGDDLHLIIDDRGEYHNVDPETVEEYTTMDATDGTRIYEGDIIEWFSNPLDTRKGFIFLTCGAWYVSTRGDAFRLSKIADNDDGNMNIEVVGNTEDDPDFLAEAMFFGTKTD